MVAFTSECATGPLFNSGAIWKKGRHPACGPTVGGAVCLRLRIMECLAGSVAQLQVGNPGTLKMLLLHCESIKSYSLHILKQPGEKCTEPKGSRANQWSEKHVKSQVCRGRFASRRWGLHTVLMRRYGDVTNSYMLRLHGCVHCSTDSQQKKNFICCLQYNTADVDRKKSKERRDMFFCE